MSENENKRYQKKLLILIVAYNASRTIKTVVTKIPRSLCKVYDTNILIIDDASHDKTFEQATNIDQDRKLPFKIQVLFNSHNLGYGGNQKIGFHFAIEQGYDYVVLLHGDGQYAPEYMERLIKPLADGSADMVMGSRMFVPFSALKEGMPLYKYVGNKILTWLQNKMLGTNLSEFHTGYRIYSVAALKKVPYELNVNDFHFDTEIAIQFHLAGLKIKELPIPTYDGAEISFMNGIRYAWSVIWTTFKAMAMDFSLGYERKYDCRATGLSNVHYQPKLNFLSPAKVAISMIESGKRVLDIGCAGGHLGAELRRKGCHVTGVDNCPLSDGDTLDAFYQRDLNVDDLPVKLEDYDYVVMLDIIEHLLYPEVFIDRMRRAATCAPHVKFIISTGNIAFIVTRLMLLIGEFHYAKRGILDITHTRLFTFQTLSKLLEQGGFAIVKKDGIPAPFPLMFGENLFSRFLLGTNRLLIKIRKSLFAYQIFMVAQPNPSAPYLLKQAHEAAKRRSIQKI